ncbi:MAG TPA: hypothetical protein VE684_17365 [Crenalkalicoccus sp.]|nr:hypothetical protein [Crenalkalicoccus sp.]
MRRTALLLLAALPVALVAPAGAQTQAGGTPPSCDARQQACIRQCYINPSEGCQDSCAQDHARCVMNPSALRTQRPGGRSP